MDPYADKAGLIRKFPNLPPFKWFTVPKETTLLTSSGRKPKFISVHSWQGDLLSLSPTSTKWVFWDNDSLFKLAGDVVHTAIFALNKYLYDLGFPQVCRTWYKKYDYLTRKWSFYDIFSRSGPRSIPRSSLRVRRRYFRNHSFFGASSSVSKLSHKSLVTSPGSKQPYFWKPFFDKVAAFRMSAESTLQPYFDSKEQTLSYLQSFANPLGVDLKKLQSQAVSSALSYFDSYFPRLGAARQSVGDFYSDYPEYSSIQNNLSNSTVVSI